MLADAALEGIAAVVFDEFHERSLDADLGLALARDVQQGLRADLKLLVMSATIDGARVSRLLGDVPVIESAGRAFPVETRYLGRDPQHPIERQVADAIARALRTEPGSVLAFLPGTAEIRRTEAIMRERIADPVIDIAPLHGALEAQLQDRAIAPAPPGRRKVVLATSIAETSLTIEGVRMVVDCGLARVPRYEPEVGLTRLETVRVSRASADQRRGRAGRLEPGVCYRMWDEPQTAALEPANRPEILAADLSAFVLDLAQWGVTDSAALGFLDPPPAPALVEAKALLRELGALNRDDRMTQEGRRLRALPLPPRLARMVAAAATSGQAELAAEIAAVLSERGLGGDDVDLEHRLDRLRRDRSRRNQDALAMARRWAQLIDAQERGGARGGSVPAARSPGALLALAYPDRIARNRGGGESFLLANGRGANVDPAAALARAPFLAVAEISGTAAQGRIVLAAVLTLAEIEAEFADRIESRDEIVFDQASASLRARRLRRLGAISLAEQPLKVAADAETSGMLAQGIVRLGIERLPWTKPLKQWRDRVMFLRRLPDRGGEVWPDLSDTALAATAADWLAPVLAGKTALAALTSDELTRGLHALLSWDLRQRLGPRLPPISRRRPDRRCRSITKPRRAGARHSGAGAVRSRPPSDHRRRASAAAGRAVVARASARCRSCRQDSPGFWRGGYAAVKAG